jgi:hypothetical protein
MRALLILATSMLLTLVAPPAALASRCQLSCRTETCAVKDGADKPLPLSRAKWSTVDACDKLSVTQGGVELRYMHRNRWFRPPAFKEGQALGEVFARNPADRPCAVLSADCLQLAMSIKQVAVGGHGIDQRDSRPGGEGEPCTMGLPCGSLLPRDTETTWRLARPDFLGTLSIRLARGTPAAGFATELSLSFEQGRAVVAGNKLQPGGVYTYQLSDASGKPVASGEFSLLSAPMAQRLQQRVQQRMEQDGLAAQAAWYDVLAENLLLWDALQMQAE